MSTTEMEFTQKIKFAEEWLQKAREKYEQGSSIEAGSNVILAIAEMETLKRSFFVEPDPVPEPVLIPKSFSFDMRPVLALALFFIAIGIFIYSVSGRLNTDSRNKINMPATHFESGSKELLARNNLFEPIEQSNLSILTAEEISPIVESNDVTAPETDNSVPAVNKPEPKRSSRRPVKETKPAVEEPAISIASADMPANTDSESKEELSELTVADIQLETIYAARESLNNE